MTPPEKPPWLKIPLPGSGGFKEIRRTLRAKKLCTVCVEAACPNLGECWGRGTMTVMILGSQCTRQCRFCNVKTGALLPPDPAEPRRVAETLAELNIRYGVITSVTRDDLPDFGAAHWAEVIRELNLRKIRVEALLPDFMGDVSALSLVADSLPHVFSHNIETVERLTPLVRSGASYERSLDVLRFGVSRNLKVKSSLLLGIGETISEVHQTLRDLRSAGVNRLAMGQYLQPSRAHMTVVSYLSPETFLELELHARELGFIRVESGPLVRSSYHADYGE
ncbi:lipoyl synthase [Myxococcota bacterium]|nr:lipoyl synthase [Myxococcota bacterium]MBU1536978.1 lipoyl synthase [Myxococcota bacterium]